MTVFQNLPYNFSTHSKYQVRFARTREEVRRAQKLRFRVFNKELGEGLEKSYKNERDEDQYDSQCHHLLVIDRASDTVVGTYRMQTHKMANSMEGFYTENEFDLDCLPGKLLEKSVEVGRACIDSNHRNGRVLFLLWRGLAEYLKQTHSRYLLGCCSLTSQCKKEAWKVMSYLVDRGFVNEEYMVPVNSGYACEKVQVDKNSAKNVKLPQLFRLYMDIGAKVCSPPALDRSFKTIDYLVILDIEDLDERTKMLFFK